MPTCFVIQPFDKSQFDKRFKDVFKPALKEAGLDAYRVDEDPSAEIAIESIEDGIKDSSICLAEITTDNPNVWFELGYALAANKPVILLCSDERQGARFPFDIQHRMILTYNTQSKSDFDELAAKITRRATALLAKGAAMRQIAENERIAPSDGLSQLELMVLAIAAGETALPNSTTHLGYLIRQSESAGITSVAFGLAIRRLIRKEFIETVYEEDEYNREPCEAARLTPEGWNWVENNYTRFSLSRPVQNTVETGDDIPF